MIISIKKTIEHLQNGKAIATITDTVFGLAALPNSLKGMAEIFRLKGRSMEKTLPLLGHNLMAFLPWVEEGDLLKIAPLCNAFWPGPLTIIVQAKADYPYLTQEKTVAIRVPNCPPLLNLLKKIGPLATTSANLSGTPPLLDKEAIEVTWGKDFPIFFSPFCFIKTPSTILKIKENGYSIVREGAITEKEIIERMRGIND